MLIDEILRQHIFHITGIKNCVLDIIDLCIHLCVFCISKQRLKQPALMFKSISKAELHFLYLHRINSYFFISKFLQFSYSNGSSTSNSTVSFSLSACILPLCNSTISFAIASPRPAPPLLEILAVSNL